MTITNVANLVESNGKTWRQNNLAIDHTIPLGTLVEVDLDYSDHHGIRLFVVMHTRDCDGSPMYALGSSSNPDDSKYYPQWIRRYVDDGFSDECLKVIAPPSDAWANKR